MSPTLSVIIVNFKNPSLLRLCLKSLAASLPHGFSYEVVVVDVATSIETQNVVREEFAAIFPNLVLVPFHENIGYTRGVNEGIRHSHGTILLNINPDIIPEPGSIPALCTFLEAHPEIGLLGPQLVNFDGSRQDSCFRFYTPLTVLYRRITHLPFSQRVLNPFLMRDVDLTRPQLVDWLMGSALLMRRDALTRVGLMDEQFFLYFSEVDFAHQFWKNGYAVAYYPGVRMYHYHQRHSKGRFALFDLLLRKESRWHLIDGIRYFLKYGFASAPRPQVQLHGIA